MIELNSPLEPRTFEYRGATATYFQADADVVVFVALRTERDEVTGEPSTRRAALRLVAEYVTKLEGIVQPPAEPDGDREPVEWPEAGRPPRFIADELCEIAVSEEAIEARARILRLCPYPLLHALDGRITRLYREATAQGKD